MDTGYATLKCVLRVHMNCDACKRHTMEILSTIVGAYDLTIDSERGTAQIIGQVDPNYCIRAITRCNGHAELVRANLSHPKMRRGGLYGQYDDYGGSSSLYYDGYGDSYGYRRSLPEGMWNDYPTTRNTYGLPEYSSYNRYGGFGYDEPRVITQHPSRFDYVPIYEESSSFCNIM